MTDRNIDQPFRGRYNHDIFNPEFFALDFHEDNNRLTGITVGVHKNATTFTLTMATVEVYANRQVDEEETDSDNDVLVLSVDEILPSDLIDIKSRLLQSEDFDEYLVKQTY
jgi:hypothetical protein